MRCSTMTTASNIAAMVRDGATDEDVADFIAASEHADADAQDAMRDDDSEWGDRQRGYGQSDHIARNDAGEWMGFM